MGFTQGASRVVSALQASDLHFCDAEKRPVLCVCQIEQVFDREKRRIVMRSATGTASGQPAAHCPIRKTSHDAPSVNPLCACARRSVFSRASWTTRRGRPGPAASGAAETASSPASATKQQEHLSVKTRASAIFLDAASPCRVRKAVP